MSGPPFPRAVVTGANRGLGLEFVRQLLAAGTHVVAGCRRPGEATALNRLAGDLPGHLHVLPLDIADARSRQAFATEAAGLHEGLELLVNNAGVLHSGERFGALEEKVLTHSLATNAVGPWLLTEALAPLLARGGWTPDEKARVLNISSEMGAMTTLARELRAPSYRISKAALNMAGVLMARALNPQGIGVITVHPGWVRTDMGGDGASVPPDAAVRDLLAVATGGRALPAGEFVDAQGHPLPW
ncbi:SDR family oxidoreductase [Arenimonas composti]|uniref:Short-chain dehydrogenase n=1 Tax=Arenimonas composti TR7-09 = DSM 18010 TaxID=1121013 RepID=A0A091BGG5_9GAMM|nr:SDR family oxidoreductase [Arenimonas composti]KFN50627.1 hypothetical protein P873_05560 [Arenimonas composti TR7-09 = DSM 18010]